jgi:hypothetical protein
MLDVHPCVSCDYFQHSLINLLKVYAISVSTSRTEVLCDIFVSKV